MRPGTKPTISQDLTAFDITAAAIVVRQRIVDPMAWAVIGDTKVTGTPMSTPHHPPAWWADALITG